MSTIALPAGQAAARRPGEAAWSPWQNVGPASCSRRTCSCSWSSRCIPVVYGLWLARHPASYVAPVRGPDLLPIRAQHARLPGRRHQRQDGGRAVSCPASSSHARTWIKWLSLLFILPWAVPSIPTILSFRFMLNPEWGIINSLIFRYTGSTAPTGSTTAARAVDRDARAHLEVAAVLDADPDRGTARHSRRALRGRVGGRRVRSGRSSSSSRGRRCARSISRARSCR